MNNQSLIGRFKPVMEWTATRSGKVFIKYGEEGTTRTCHVCRHKVTGGIPLEVRDWTCPVCQTHHLRDENAAQNGVGKVLEEIVLPRSGHTPVTITARWAWQVSPSGVLVTPRGCDGSDDEFGHCQEIKPGSLLPGPDPVVANA
jgi:putative transposase